MNKNTLFLLLVLTPTIFFFNFQVKEVSAQGSLAWSAPTLQLYSRSPATYYDPNYKIKVINTGSSNITVRATGEILNLDDWQEYFTIAWDKNDIKLQPNESTYFIPTIFINVTTAFDYNFHFVFTGTTKVNGSNVIVAGGGGTAIITVYADNVGKILELRSTDQGDVERMSTMELYYGGVNATGWAIIKTIEDSYYKNIVLTGWYKVIATERDTGQQRTGEFLVENDTQYNIVFDLIQFSEWQPFMKNGSLVINWTISNQYVSLPAVTVRFILEKDNQILAVDEFEYVIFEKGNRKNNAILKTEWNNGNYTIKSEIWTNNEIYLNRTDYQILSGILPKIFIDLYNSPLIPLAIFTIILSTGMFIGINKDKIKEKIRKVIKGLQKENKEEVKLEVPQIDESEL